MDLMHIIALALLQGLTEFLPISSSGHLILVPRLLGWTEQGLAFDVAVHVGTLTAVVWYFRHDVLELAQSWFCSLAAGKQDANSRLAWGVILGTIPVGLAGLMFSSIVEGSLRSPWVIAGTTVGFGLLLGVADSRGRRTRDEHSLAITDILWIGLAQALALVPGTSRSGITITAGLLLGLTREAAARFSFLLSIPVIVLAGGLETAQLVQQPDPVAWLDIILGASISAASAYLCIHVFLKLIGRSGMWPFVVYRLVLGAVIVAAFP